MPGLTLFHLAYLDSSNITALAVLASNPVVGSSKKRILGLMINSIPILVLFLSPPDTPRMKETPTWLVEKEHKN